MQIHVIDTDPGSASVGGWLEDTSLIEKYKMSDEEYNKRENTYRCVTVYVHACAYACIP